MDIIEICTAYKSEVCLKLIEYAQNCSWQGTGQYFAECLADNDFDKSEKIIAALLDGKIVGFAGLVKESCINNSEFTPWLDFLFVDEKYRNRGIAKALIDFILGIARRDKIDNVYLCTVSHEEMYERFGFRTICRTRINGGDECCVMKMQLF